MRFLEALEGGAHLGHHRSCIGKVHAPDVGALECIDRALGHAIALSAQSTNEMVRLAPPSSTTCAPPA